MPADPADPLDPGARQRLAEDEPHYACTRDHCTEGKPEECWAQAARPDLDPAAVEAAARAIADVDGSEAWPAYMDEATAAITAYLDRSGLAEAESEIKAMFAETEQRLIAKVDALVAERDEARSAVARLEAENAELRCVKCGLMTHGRHAYTDCPPVDEAKARGFRHRPGP